MNCRQVRDLLPLYADGDLQGRVHDEVAEHVQVCAACRRRMEADGALAQALPALPAAGDAAAMSRRLRSRVMDDITRHQRRRSVRRRAAWAGNLAAWGAVAAVATLLILGLGYTWRSLITRQRQLAHATTVPANARWQIVSDTVIASPYYWPTEGQYTDRTPQLSPDGTRLAFLPTVGGGTAADVDLIVVRDLATGQDRTLVAADPGYSYTSIRWSPDSRSLAYVRYQTGQPAGAPSELWRIDADGRNAKLLYQRGPCTPGPNGPALGIIRWSGDGKTIAADSTIFDCLGPDTTVRVRADGSGSEPLKAVGAAELGVAEGDFSGSTVAAADGYDLAVVKTDALPSRPADAPAGGTSLVLYEYASKKTQVLASFAGQIVAPDANNVSPDGQWILFQVRPDANSSTGATLWTVRRDGSGLRQISFNAQPISPMPGPVWAGGGIAFFNQPREVSAIWICRADAATGQAQLIDNRWPAWDLVSASRDGRRLLAIKGMNDQAELHLLELAPIAPPAPEKVTIYRQGQADVLAPDMSNYAPLTQAAGQVLAGVRPSIVAAMAMPWQQAERIKQEGIAVELTYPAPGIVVSDHGAFTTALIPLSEPVQAHEATVFLGSGEATVVVSTEADEALATLRQLLGLTPEPTQGPPAPPTVAPEAPPAFGAPRDLFALPSGAGFFSLSPDGQWVLYPAPGASAADGAHLELYSTVSGQVTGIQIAAAGTDPAASQYAWFPDSRRLLVTTNGGQGQILVKPLGPEPAQTLARAPQGSAGFGEAAISPDGQRIAYIVYYDASPAPVPRTGIEVMNADGSGRRQLVEPDFFLGHLAWTPDGKQVVYFQGKGGTPPDDGDAYVVDADGGAAPRLLFPRLRLAAFSPDGARALWLGEPADEQGRADLFLTDWPATGGPTCVAKGVSATTALWAGGSGWFIYGQGSDLYLAGARGGAPAQKLLPRPETAADPLLWVAGRGLIYRAANNEGMAQLRLLPLAGVPAVTPTAQAASPEVTATVTPAAPVTVTLTAIHMLDAQMGWGMANPVRVLRTTDGGQTWQDVTPVEITASSRDVTVANTNSYFRDALHAWLAVPNGDGNHLRIYRTSDGGQSWQSADIEPEGMGAQFSFIDDQHGWLLLHQGVAAGSEAVTVLGTADGGATWQALNSANPQNTQAGALPFGGDKSGIAFSDLQTGWVTGAEPVDGLVYLYVTHDGGRTWQPQKVDMPKGFEKAQTGAQPPVFSSPQDGLLPVVLWQEQTAIVLYRTQDGGATWTAGEPFSAPEVGLMACPERAPGLAWVIYSSGKEIGTTKDGGATWQKVTPQPALQDAYMQLDALDAQHAWIVGEGALLRTQDGGQTWERIEPSLAR